MVMATRHGPVVHGDGTVTFRVWTPACGEVELALGGELRPMERVEGGWFALREAARHGSRYAFHLDGGDARPDPASRWQPDGVHLASAVLDPSTFRWSEAHRRWRGAPLAGAVLYELHVGTFTPEGTFAAAAQHLDDLAALGVTHVEVMPVGAFDGPFGWGYDGVQWRAVDADYGGDDPEGAPQAFAAFVDACHQRGLAVALDVVLNHLGPSGNYLAEYGPYFREDRASPWGQALNLDGPSSGPVRAFLQEAALGWLADYGVDALRLDAVHALADESATHVLAELAHATAALGAQQGRTLVLVAESDRCDPATVTERTAGGLGLDGVWADDLHHAIRTAVTGEREGYYADYRGLEDIARAWRHGFVFDGSRHASFRGCSPGAPVPDTLPGWRFVACTENHDQVGNRARGERLEALADPELVKAAIAMLLAGPGTLLLFMGQEYDERAPFAFFAGHPDPQLAEATRRGRQQEFAGFSGFDAQGVPDPTAEATRVASTLDHARRLTGAGEARWALWHDLLALRRSEPALGNGRRDLVVAHEVSERRLVIDRGDPAAPAVRLVVDLDGDVAVPAGWTVLADTRAPRYGGTGSGPGAVLLRAAG